MWLQDIESVLLGDPMQGHAQPFPMHTVEEYGHGVSPGGDHNFSHFPASHQCDSTCSSVDVCCRTQDLVQPAATAAPKCHDDRGGYHGVESDYYCPTFPTSSPVNEHLKIDPDNSPHATLTPDNCQSVPSNYHQNAMTVTSTSYDDGPSKDQYATFQHSISHDSTHHQYRQYYESRCHEESNRVDYWSNAHYQYEVDPAAHQGYQNGVYEDASLCSERYGAAECVAGTTSIPTRPDGAWNNHKKKTTDAESVIYNVHKNLRGNLKPWFSFQL
jgi:hypothetical protein